MISRQIKCCGQNLVFVDGLVSQNGLNLHSICDNQAVRRTNILEIELVRLNQNLNIDVNGNSNSFLDSYSYNYNRDCNLTDDGKVEYIKKLRQILKAAFDIGIVVLSCWQESGMTKFEHLNNEWASSNHVIHIMN